MLPDKSMQIADRRSDYDVTNTVQVSSVYAVREAVRELFVNCYPTTSFDAIWMAFHDFDQMYEGLSSEYRGCDTIYHDKQHSLDVTLAVARLLAGYEQTSSEHNRLGHNRATMTLITALFHDSGYIRRRGETRWLNGAEFTIWHVSRSAEYLADYMYRNGLAEWAQVASRIVHFTGYEINLDDIEVEDPRDRLAGHLLGTADLITQMADRCYLEKCRDRLYSEFVLAGMAIHDHPSVKRKVVYRSGIDLLKKTPGFFKDSARIRLNKNFSRAYRNINVLFEGQNPYIDVIEHNLNYLVQVIRSGAWPKLRRRPPCFTALAEPLRSVSALVSRYLAAVGAPAGALVTP